MDEVVLIEEKDGFLERLYFSGVSTGKLEIHYEDGKYIVLKEHGHRFWGAMGYYPYAKARFIVCLKLSDWEQAEYGRFIKVKRLLDFPIRKERK